MSGSPSTTTGTGPAATGTATTTGTGTAATGTPTGTTATGTPTATATTPSATATPVTPPTTKKSTDMTTTHGSAAAPAPRPPHESELLLKAGAVLPHGTPDAGPEAVDLTARAYRHPALADDRVVVRLAPAELGAAEDLATGFLGLVPDGEPALVGLGRRQALGFPEWVLVHHPEDGHHALALVPEMERVARRAKTKPKAALEDCQELAGRLAAAVPHFLPVFYEEAARVFLSVENPTFAAQLFTRARKAEATHGLAVDQDRLDAVFLEFALAGALPVRVLTSYAKELEARVAAPEAYERFRRLCVRRTAGGMAPSAQAAPALRRLARAAGLDPAAAEQDFLAELLPLPATLRATTAWWKSHKPALTALGRRVPAVRGTLLTLMPPCEGYDDEMSPLWLDILEESGATAGLTSAEVTPEERCADGAAGWLERFAKARHTQWSRRPGLPLLLDVVTRAADRLHAELDGPGREKGLDVGVGDVDLIDLLLSLGLPVAGPGPQAVLNLNGWAATAGRRDLLALAADERFRAAFDQAAYAFGDDDFSRTAIRRLADSPGGRPMLAAWVREVARNSAATGLPLLPEKTARLTWLPAEALALAEPEVAAAAATDLGALFARTLRGGLFEELAWPAWEEALAALDPKGNRNDLTVVSAWPHLIVANDRQVRVIGADSTLLVHDLRIPGDNRRSTGFQYADGALLVCWRPWYGGGEAQGYWHTAPDQIFPLDNGKQSWRLALQQIGLPLPDGGLATGEGVLHRGDTRLPLERPVISDGITYWAWHGEERPAGWYEFDPADGSRGRHSLPGFLADALQGLPEGSTLCENTSWLRPAPHVEGSVTGAPVDGLLGWRAVALPGGGWRAGDTAGRTVTVPEDSDYPVAAVTFPGDDRPRALSHHWQSFRLTDPDGVVTASGGMRPGNGHGGHGPKLPPADHWFCLRTRDHEGSLALRGIGTDTASALFAAAAKAVPAPDTYTHQGTGVTRATVELTALVRTALPQVTDPALVEGVVAQLGQALDQRALLDGIARRLAAGTDAEPGSRVPDGPNDGVLAHAVSGLTGNTRYGWMNNDGHGWFEALRAFSGALADTAATAVPGRLHCDVPGLPYAGLAWTEYLEHPAALAYRAVAATTSAEHREALLALLAELDGLGLAAAATGRWRRVTVELTQRDLLKEDGSHHNVHHRGVLPLGEGAFLASTEHCVSVPTGFSLGMLQHDPAGRFELPAPYTERGTSPLGDAGREADWLTRFLKEAADRGPAPWLPEAVEEFARLTGVPDVLAGLVIAGLPGVDAYERGFLTTEQRTVLSVKVADAAVAKDDLGAVTGAVRRAVLGALLPEDPARLWTHGPDTAAAAEVWNRLVGRRTPTPQWLVTEAHRSVKGAWPALRSLPAVLSPATSAALSTDVAWEVKGDRVAPREGGANGGFSGEVLTGAVAMLAWLAHRLPAGDPLRAQLPPALTAVRDRLAAPDLMLSLGRYVGLAEFRKAAGAPTRTTEHYEEYGAVVMATHDGQPMPALRPSLLDSAGGCPYLPLLRGTYQQPFPAETALRLAGDLRFAALLADPGAPAAGETAADGTWWPQDPTRSVPGLVAEAAASYGLGEDAAALYLMLLAMPDPTDRNTARWTGWKPARLKAARAELAATDLVVQAVRTRAGRSLFLPGGWAELASPVVPVEEWKAPMYELLAGGSAHLGVLMPTEPVADLYRRAWERVRSGDVPRFAELKVRRRARRR
ncbi:DNA-binding protein [Streptomyces sp. NPDC101118]|uniref:DNA-binding protein n=1 Tax=Streptomyces sp. NPDC101118 TaxID=3366109 RepID=UPI00382921F2